MAKRSPRLPADDAASVADKAARARAAQPAWAARPLAERKACIERFREGVVRDLESLAVTMTRETGKPIRMSRNELNGLLGRIDFFIGMVEPVTASETVFDEGGMQERIEHVPLGVVGNISAWNYPWFVGCNVILPALLTGNAVLYKPSEFATLTGLEIARLLHAAPACRGTCSSRWWAPARSAPRCWSSSIDGLFFTGSYATGTRIAQTVGSRFIKLQLELGGKDPTYVCDDADPKAAAQSLADGAMYNTGQSCCSVERIYVHVKVHDAFLAAFVETVKGFKTGDPMREDTYIGPITRAQQLGRAGRAGGRCQCQGRPPAHRRTQAPGAGQLVRAYRVQQCQPRHGTDARGELRARHWHPDGVGRRGGGAADERHALRADGRRVHAGPRTGAGAAGAGQCRQPVLELLRPCQPAPAVERLRRLGRGCDAVQLRDRDLYPAEGLASEGRRVSRGPERRE